MRFAVLLAGLPLIVPFPGIDDIQFTFLKTPVIPGADVPIEARRAGVTKDVHAHPVGAAPGRSERRYNGRS